MPCRAWVSRGRPLRRVDRDGSALTFVRAHRSFAADRDIGSPAGSGRSPALLNRCSLRFAPQHDQAEVGKSLILCLGQGAPDRSVGHRSIGPEDDHRRQLIIGGGTLTESLEPGPASPGFGRPARRRGLISSTRP